MSDRLPRTPPEALARLEQLALRPLVQNNRDQPTATDEECSELVDAHEDLQKLDVVGKDETRKDLQQCSDDQEKTRQALEDPQKFTTASTDLETHKDLQRSRDDQEKTRQELETLREELRDTKAQHATQLAALRQEHETKLKDAKSAYASLETYAQTMSEHFKTARSLVSTQNWQFSELHTMFMTLESAHRTALQQRNQFALVLRDTKSQYDRLVEFVENTIPK